MVTTFIHTYVYVFQLVYYKKKKKLSITNPLRFTFGTNLNYCKFLTHLLYHKLNCLLLIYYYLLTIITITNICRQKYYYNGFKLLQMLN